MTTTEIQLGSRTVLIEDQYLPLWERMQKLRTEIHKKQIALTDVQLNSDEYKQGIQQLQVLNGEVQRIHRQLMLHAQ